MGYIKEKLAVALLTLTMVAGSVLGSGYALAADAQGETGGDQGEQISFVLTSDMHSHEEKHAKIATLIKDARQSNDATYVLDGGDFSMGTPYQTIYQMEAPDLRLMGSMGYDVTTFGNHEFDCRSSGLRTMLERAIQSGDPLPKIVNCNIDWKATLGDRELREDGAALKKAMEDYGVADYTVIRHGDTKIAVFGVFGKESDSYAPESGTRFEDPIKAAQRTVKAIKKHEKDIDMIVCVSHSGTYPADGNTNNESQKKKSGLIDTTYETDPDKQEDVDLAENVDGIDLILSGHSHTYLYKPIERNGTIIAAVGEYNANAGLLSFTKSEGEAKYELSSYQLQPLDDSVADDPATAAKVAEMKSMADQEYFSRYGLKWDQVLATNDIDFTPIGHFALKQGEDTLGNLLSDSYIYGVEQAEGEDYERVDVAVAPAGIIRGSFAKGPVTTADAFNALSLGTGADGESGYPLVSVYLTGKELKLTAEVDASVSDLMQPARLYNSGLAYSYNPHRLILDKAYDIHLVREDGKREEIQDDKLYRVVADLYSAQMLGTVNSMSRGLLSLVPKHADGTPVKDYEKCIIHDTNGKELKEWYALASYIQSFPDGQFPQKYAKTEGRKVLVNSRNPIELLKQPNRFFFMITGIVLVLILLIVLVVWIIRRAVRRRRSSRRSRRRRAA